MSSRAAMLREERVRDLVDELRATEDGAAIFDNEIYAIMIALDREAAKKTALADIIEGLSDCLSRWPDSKRFSDEDMPLVTEYIEEILGGI